MDEQAKAVIEVLDSALTHLQEANKRLARLLALSLIILSALISVVLYR